jgi:hypothetical protein
MDMKLQMSHLGPGKSTIVVAEQEKANMTEMTLILHWQVTLESPADFVFAGD